MFNKEQLSYLINDPEKLKYPVEILGGKTFFTLLEKKQHTNVYDEIKNAAKKIKLKSIDELKSICRGIKICVGDMKEKQKIYEKLDVLCFHFEEFLSLHIDK